MQTLRWLRVCQGKEMSRERGVKRKRCQERKMSAERELNRKNIQEKDMVSKGVKSNRSQEKKNQKVQKRRREKDLSRGWDVKRKRCQETELSSQETEIAVVTYCHYKWLTQSFAQQISTGSRGLDQGFLTEPQHAVCLSFEAPPQLLYAKFSARTHFPVGSFRLQPSAAFICMILYYCTILIYIILISSRSIVGCLSITFLFGTQQRTSD